MSGLLLALGAGWGAASAPQAATAPATAAATPAVTPAPNAPRLTIDIGQLNDSGVTGTATLYEAGQDQTIVEIAVKNAAGNHPAHIHAGTCDKIAAEPAYDLQNIDKNGKSTTLIKVSLANLLAKPYVIDAHLSPNELGTLIMCGAITGKPVTPAATAIATAPAATKAAAAATTAPAATKPAATTPAATTPPLPTAVATTPPTATATAAIAPTGAGGETGVTPATTPAATTTPITPVSLTPVTSGKGIPAANSVMGGDGTGGSTASSTTITVAEASATSGGSASAPLPSVDGSGVTGTATIFPAADGAGAVIQVSLQGDLVSAGNLVHLHRGTCDNLDQDYTVELNPVNDNGVSETTVDIPYQELLTGGYAVNVHESEDAYDTWLVCGELSNSLATTGGGTAATGTGGQTAELLPQSTGAGTSIPHPETTAAAIAWGLGFFTLLIGASALLIRRRESAAFHRPSSRWLRLGL